MKYMLMMHAPRGTPNKSGSDDAGEYQITNWSPEDFKAHIAFMHRYNKELIEAGEWIEAQGLTPPGQAKVVRAAKNGVPVTDGVFPESKEFLAGFWIVEVESAERAYQLAAKASAAPGPGGKPLNMPIEVRQVMGAPPDQG
jgi:hypothetical protein